jgi:hypothetical protein
MYTGLLVPGIYAYLSAARNMRNVIYMLLDTHVTRRFKPWSHFTSSQRVQERALVSRTRLGVKDTEEDKFDRFE